MAVVIAMLAAALFSSTLDTSTNAGAELDDMATIADEMGITLQEAVKGYGWNDDFARMVSEIRASSPEELATAEITGDDSASVYFAGEISAWAQALVDAFKGDFPSVKVATQENKGFTEQEIEAATVGAHYAVFRTAGVLGATSSFDHSAMRIDIIVQTGGAPTDPTGDSLRRVAEGGARDATRPDLLDLVSVSVTLVTHPVSFVDSGSKHTGGEMWGNHVEFYPTAEKSPSFPRKRESGGQ